LICAPDGESDKKFMVLSEPEEFCFFWSAALSRRFFLSVFNKNKPNKAAEKRRTPNCHLLWSAALFRRF